jgi:hypothetical protein
LSAARRHGGRPAGRTASERARAAWEARIDAHAYGRLRELRQRGLWREGKLPVPVDHVIERLLGLDICYAEFAANADAPAALDVAGRAVLINERMQPLFEAVPGLLAFCKGHEAGHADLYGLAGRHEQVATDVHGAGAGGRYEPARTLAYRSPAGAGVGAREAVEVSVLRSDEFRRLSRETKTRFYHKVLNDERARQAAGEDTGLVRRTVDRYAATLLMPEDLLREHARGLDVTRPDHLRSLADRFEVSHAAMAHRVVELRMAYRGEDGTLTLDNPADAAQGRLF